MTGTDLGRLPAPGNTVRRASVIALLTGWCLFLAVSAYQSLSLFFAGLGEAPEYGDTNEYWASADRLRVDDVRTWLYPALLRFAPGETRSTETIATVQLLQFGAAVAASAFFGWVLARLLALPTRWLALAVLSCGVLSGASVMSVHMSHSILQDSLASSAWVALTAAILALFLPGRLRPALWLASALPAAVLVAGLRWERLYVAIPLFLLAAALLALPAFSAGWSPARRARLTMIGGTSVVMLIAYWVARSAFKTDGRELPETGDIAARLLNIPVTVSKTFLESIVSPITSVISTNTQDVVKGLGAVGWTNSRLLEHIGYWPYFLWLSSALLVAVALLSALIFGLPALLGRPRSAGAAWLLIAASIAGVAGISALTYGLFHPRYALPITAIELALAALLPLVLIRVRLTDADDGGGHGGSGEQGPTEHAEEAAPTVESPR